MKIEIVHHFIRDFFGFTGEFSFQEITTLEVCVDFCFEPKILLFYFFLYSSSGFCVGFVLWS